MSVRNALVLFLALSTMSLLVGCGNGGNSSTPPPSGGFTNSSLSGTYVFYFSGIDFIDQTESNFAMAGTLIANGSGSFSSGSLMDMNDPALAAAAGASSSVLTSLPVIGSYSVSADGRGTGVLDVTVNGNQAQIGIDFVLSSTAGGLISRFDPDGTGSGTITLQTAGVGQSALANNSYSFGLNGVDLDGDPLGAVGSFALDGSGNATGTEDFNDNGNSSNLTDVSLVTPSNVLAGSPGTAQLDGEAGLLGALTFDVWIVNSTQLVLIETDSSENILVGNAFLSTGQTAFPSGQVVFTMTGGPLSGNPNNTSQVPIYTGGLFTAQGGVVSNGIQDANIAGNLATAQNVGGGYSSVGARALLTLTGIYNVITSDAPPVTGGFGFAAYPYNGGVFLLEADNLGGIEAGVAYPQTSTSLAASQGYALNLSGANGDGEVDMIAEFVTNSSGGFSSGLYDANNAGELVSSAQLNGDNSTPPTYTNNANGRGAISFPALQVNNNTSVINELSLIFYAVNDSTLVFMENDTDQGSVGTLQLQTGTGSAGAVRPAFSMVRPVVRSHGTLRKKK